MSTEKYNSIASKLKFDRRAYINQKARPFSENK